MSLSTPQQVQERLDQLEQELADRQNEYERSAGAKARLTREWEKRLAMARLKAKGADADTRKAAALVMASEIEDDAGNLYDRLAEAESTFEICRAAVKMREIRVGIGQSILKAQGRA